MHVLSSTTFSLEAWGKKIKDAKAKGRDDQLEILVNKFVAACTEVRSFCPIDMEWK